MLAFKTLVVIVITFDVVNSHSGRLGCTERHAWQVFFIPGYNCTMQHIKFLQKENFHFTSRYPEEAPTINKLTFEDSTILYMPRKLFEALESLQFLYMSQCNLLKLSQNDFQNAANLQMITLSDNKLEELPKSVFDGADQLRMIDLSRNKISKIDSDVFNDLKSLFMLELSFNKIKVLADSLFANNLQLDYLDLSFNLLQSINKQLIKHLKLNIFSVYHNELEHLDIVNNIHVLDASDNKLSIEKLQISSDSSNNSTSKLKVLKLSKNNLTSIDFIKNCTNLKELDVSKNPLHSGIIRDELFTELTQLKRLNLSSMNLTQLDFRLFSNLQNLEELDVSDNPNINSINFNDRGLKKLKILYLNDLNVRNIVVTNFSDLFPELCLIDISGNCWSCSDLRIILNELDRLNIKTPLDIDSFTKHMDVNIRGIYCCPNDTLEQLGQTNYEIVKMDLNLAESRLNPNRAEFAHLKVIMLLALSVIGFGIMFIVFKADLRKCRRIVLDSYKHPSKVDIM